MAKTDTPRHQIIRRCILQQPEAAAGISISLWERLASELVSIIGQGGFDSLYSRSLHLAAATFPWLANDHPSQQTDSRFAALQSSLEGQDCAEANEASIAFLIIFIDILASLIGESLTNSILRSAWGDDALNIAVKDPRS